MHQEKFYFCLRSPYSDLSIFEEFSYFEFSFKKVNFVILVIQKTTEVEIKFFCEFEKNLKLIFSTKENKHLFQSYDKKISGIPEQIFRKFISFLDIELKEKQPFYIRIENELYNS